MSRIIVTINSEARSRFQRMLLSLQVVVNPKFEVTESAFFNKMMLCRCKYDAQRVWRHDGETGNCEAQ